MTLDSKIELIAKLILKARTVPEVKNLALEIVAEQRDGRWVVDEGDYLGELSQVYKWIRDNIRYTHDPYNNDTIESAEYVLKYRATDCDGFTVLGGALLGSIGYKVWLIVSGVNDYEHIYLLVGIPPEVPDPSRVVAFDASIDRWPGWEPEDHKISKAYRINY